MGESVQQPPPLEHASSPAELLLARCRAFGSGDFAFVYDSYHPDSNFRRQFPDRREYLEYARTVLATDFSIADCRILRERRAGEEAEIILYLDILFRGERRECFERVFLRRFAGGWRYLAAQKLDRTDFGGAVDSIDWTDFERARDKVYF